MCLEGQYQLAAKLDTGQIDQALSPCIEHLSHELPRIAMYEEETQGQRLRRLREAKELTQTQLARQAGLSGQSSIGNVENGIRGFGKSVLAIARVLGISSEYLACQTDESGAVSSSPKTTGVMLTKERMVVLTSTIANLQRLALSPACTQTCADELLERIAGLERLVRGVEREMAINAPVSQTLD